MENLTDSLSIISGIFGLLSIILTLFSFFRSTRTQSTKLKELDKKKFELVLESSDIIKLGNYLDNEIGQLTISDYVDNKSLNERVDSLLNKLTRFVGTENEIKTDLQEQEEFKKTESRQDPIKEFPFVGKLGVEFDKIINELYLGEPWNALARLRRHIEILLKDLAQKNNLNVEKVHSLTQLIDILKLNQIIEIDVARNLKYPIHVSNRAVHGQELKQGEAEEAIHHAAYSIDRIINTTPNTRS
ncbi:hypothetical protein ACE1ET_20345 [Saccharicrinis sp. FJH62]|uniref:hypothetical protein n=1 Tax=Saccharicrinis sp. FJH62 TaxID=3344657 RepID=UPI0035D4B9A5